MPNCNNCYNDKDRPLTVPTTAGIIRVRVSLPLQRPHICPICLEGFTFKGLESEEKRGEGTGEGEGRAGVEEVLLGSDGKTAVEMFCGHGFCQRCLERWRRKAVRPAFWRRKMSMRRASRSLGNIGVDGCPICDWTLSDQTKPKSRWSFPRRTWYGGNSGNSGSPTLTLPQSSISLAQSSSSTCSTNPSPNPSPGQDPLVDVRLGSLFGRKHSGHLGAGSLQDTERPPGSTPVAAAATASVAQAPKLNNDSTPSSTHTSSLAALGVAEATGSLGLGRGSLLAEQERCRRETAFRLASLRSQYPRFLPSKTLRRWLKDDFQSSWTQDPGVQDLRRRWGRRSTHRGHVFGPSQHSQHSCSAHGIDHQFDNNHGAESDATAIERLKLWSRLSPSRRAIGVLSRGEDAGARAPREGSRWAVTGSPQDGEARRGGGRKSYGGGSSSSATGTGWYGENILTKTTTAEDDS
ncbi:unnamed protein product [Discosporangium mesarthrocarpum]